MLYLSARQSVEMQVPRKSVSLHHYLKQPRRLVHALMNPTQVEELGNGCFRLRLKVVQFFMLNIWPVVDLSIDVSQDSVLTVKSIDCQIYGNEFVNQRFDLSLSGNLRLIDQGTVTQVTGQSDLAIAVDLPPMMQLTPRALLETTGNQILKGVLATMKQRLVRQLVVDYERWSTQQTLQNRPQLAIGRRATAQASCLDG
ncbi:MAG: DUF1997 domain-containing protein [Cyanobacteria bacterium J06639_14]